MNKGVHYYISLRRETLHKQRLMAYGGDCSILSDGDQHGGLRRRRR